MDTQRKFTAKDGLEMTIRPAQADDSCAIIDTVQVERHGAQLRSHGTLRQGCRVRAGVYQRLDGAKNLLIVAATGDTVVGCLAALQADGGRRPETTHILHVGLHLREAFRGLGIGPHLLDYAVAWAVEKGFKKLEANIFTTNKHSLGMFKKAGFVEEGVRKNRIQVGRELINEVLMGERCCRGRVRDCRPVH